MDDAILVLEGLAKRFPGGAGFGPVSLRLGPGVHGILGPNGSGKTTLLRTLLGFHPPSAGRARLLGHDVASSPLWVRRQVGYMSENDVVVPGLNAAQTVRLAAELCGIPRPRAHEAAAEAIHAVGLGEAAYHPMDRLSTGQRQKAKLAAALVHAPRLLILDEPTNGLDPAARRAMLDLVRIVSAEHGVSVLLSTHILPDVQAVCQDAVVLRDGLVAGVERVAARQALVEAGAAWHDVEVLGDPEAFESACKAARLRTRRVGASLQVLAPGVAPVLAAARAAGLLLTKARPASEGVEEAVLGRLEAAA